MGSSDLRTEGYKVLMGSSDLRTEGYKVLLGSELKVIRFF